jgi:hypothetical protein
MTTILRRITGYFTIAGLLLAVADAPALVVNFNVPGGQSGGINYSGQGAYADPGNNYWNPVISNGTTSPGMSSDGTTTSTVRLIERETKNYNSGAPSTQGTPEALEYWYADANSLSVQTCVLTNVPAGTYNLYLYGKNGNATFANRGTIFGVSVGGTSYGTQRTTNSFTPSFVLNNDYVVFTNLAVGAAGTITFTYSANTNIVRPPGSSDYSGTNTQGNFNGLQLISLTSSVSLPTLTNSAASGVQATSASVGGGVLTTGGAVPLVTIYYGTGNGGTNPVAWSNSVPLGYVSVGAFSATLSNLSPSTIYYFTAAATNAAGRAWALPVQSFTTAASLLAQVTNLPAANLRMNSATLAAQVLSTGGTVPEVTVFYGTNDGGTNAANWSGSVGLGSLTGAGAQTVFNLQPNTTYFHNGRASNAAGVSWAGVSRSFTTPATNPPASFAPPAPPFTLAGGWRLQSSVAVSDSGSVISQTNYSAASWYPATVPGTVLTTLVNNGVYPEPLFGTNNWNIPDSLCRTSYWYRTDFFLPANFAGNRVWLNFSGINYIADVWVNGQSIGQVQGAFMRGIFDVTACVTAGRSNAVAVFIRPQPNPGMAHTKTITDGYYNGGDTAKDGPTFLASIGWNWMPTIRDRNLGIWREVTIAGSGPVLIRNPYVTSQLPLPATNSASLTIQVTLTNATASTQIGMLTGAIGEIAFQQSFSLASNAVQTFTFYPSNTPALQIANPRLWWPNGYGAPELYQLQLAVVVDDVVSDTADVSFGIRQMSYSLPGSSNLGLVVNGVPVIAKGGNFGMDEAMKRIPRARLDAQIRMHRDAGLNMLRNWVGQSTSEDFFELCDRYGIMVWQDFYQPNPSDGPDPTNTVMYLANIQDTLLRYRNHPSIALWCGRNEGNPAPATIATGNANLTATLDPSRWYQANSSGGGSVASGGPYRWQPPENYYSVDAAFKTEIGCGMCIPTLEGVRAMLSPQDWGVINNAWAEHDVNGPPVSQNGDIYPFLLTKRYGTIASLADFVRKGQLANYEAHRAVFEGRLVQMFQPVTGILNWLTSPAHPSFIYQLYDYDLEPNASLFGVAKACEPLHVMMNQSNWRLTVINATPQSVAGLTIRTRVFNLDGTLQLQQTNSLTASASAATDVGTVSFPGGLSAVHFVQLQMFNVTNRLVSENFYWREKTQGRLESLNTLPQVTLNVQATRQQVGSNLVITVTVSNPAPVVALMAHLQLRDATSGRRILPVYYSDNYLSLLPGESRIINIEAAAASFNGHAALLAVDGWNTTVKPSTGFGSTVAIVPNTEALTAGGPLPCAARINCGGSQIGFFQFGSEPIFSRDIYNSGGTSWTTGTTIDISASNAAPAAVYAARRYGNLTYTIPSTGTNIVRLHFAEVSVGPGGRQFNVAINGQQVLTNFDIAAIAGNAKALVRDFIAVPDASSNIVIAFAAGAVNQPEVCGLEVIPVIQPVPPTQLVATPGEGRAFLAWTPTPTASSYNLRRALTNSGPYLLIASNVTAAVFTNTGLANGTTYYFAVSSLNSFGESDNTAPVAVTPQIPVSLSASITAGGQIAISWPTNGSAGRTLFYTPSLAAPVMWTLVTNTPAAFNDLWVVVLPLGTNQTGFYRLQ